MMKKNTFIHVLIMLITWSINAQKTGMNTRSPRVALEIGNNLNIEIPDGLIIPKISGAELKSKDAIYQSSYDGIMVYVDFPLNVEDTTSKTEFVVEKGYYYYDATKAKWYKIDRYLNVAAGKTIVQIKRSVTEQLIGTTDTPVVWSSISGINNEVVKLNDIDKAIIELAPGKSFRITAVVGIGTSSVATYLRTKIAPSEPLIDGAKIYMSTLGVVESNSLNEPKGAGTDPICYVYTGNSGLKLSLMARSPEDGRKTFIAGEVTTQNEGTFILIEEL
ncbi:hypothetical protein OIU80_19685 [Flavobacterium sp. LS1R47]|uniref:Uncharacterized protein n=1 Tax=Flavobacterium frigoritolerans TaxID=2987686 RepID=A0A9X3HP52_9FLAO|nr:hypothetical protein [Flavobacterium frigoritolerans]MCV9934508.1 hypothetical protein [Flavobacterium frigoritolerans]